MRGVIFAKTIYIVNVQMTGCNGDIIRRIDMAYFDESKAFEVADDMWDHRPKNDPNYLTWVNGPILLDED